jgi:hypothetical protein
MGETVSRKQHVLRRLAPQRLAGSWRKGRASRPLPLHQDPFRFNFPESSKMNVLRIVAASAIVFATGSAYAQDASTQTQPSQNLATTSVGGTPSTSTEMGSPTGKSREQVYNELIQSQHNGEADRMRALFKGGN